MAECKHDNWITLVVDESRVLCLDCNELFSLGDALTRLRKRVSEIEALLEMMRRDRGG